MSLIVNCCCYWRKTFEEAIRRSWSQHHLRDTVINESCLVFPLEEALRAWLKVLHALYQPTRGLRMTWLLQCVHLHVCMCSNRKINSGVMYMSTDLILGILSFWTSCKIGDRSDWAELQSFVIESQDMLCKLNHT